MVAIDTGAPVLAPADAGAGASTSRCKRLSVGCSYCDVACRSRREKEGTKEKRKSTVSGGKVWIEIEHELQEHV